MKSAPLYPAYDSLCIFTQTGRTFTFKNVKLIIDNESVLVFGYTAMSDSMPKVATFLKANIVGWSILHPLP